MKIVPCLIVFFFYGNFLSSQTFETEYIAAKTFLEKKEYNNALDKYKLCIEKNPKHAESLLGAGKCLFNLKKFSTSIVYLNQCILIDSNNILAFVYRGMSHFYSKNYAFSEGDYLILLRKKISFEEKKQVYSLLNQLYLETKDYQNAIKYCNEYLKIEKNDIPMIKNRASIYLEIDSFDAAIRNYELCQKINPKEASIHLLIGHVYFNKNDYKTAIDLYNISMFEDSLEIISRKSRAESYVAMENYPLAIEDYLLLSKKDKFNALYYFELGFCYLMLEDNQNALKNLNLAFENNYEDLSELLLFRAIAYNNLKQIEMACFDIKKSIELGNLKATAYKDKFCL